MGLLTIAGGITGVAAAIVVVWKVVKWFKNIVEGIRCQLRTEMLRIYYHNETAGAIRQYEKQNFLMLYAAYKALGGNSFIDEIHEVVMTWKVVT